MQNFESASSVEPHVRVTDNSSLLNKSVTHTSSTDDVVRLDASIIGAHGRKGNPSCKLKVYRLHNRQWINIMC